MAFSATWNPDNASASDKETIAGFTINNSTAAMKESITAWGTPDYNAAVNISSYNSSSNQYTCPACGIVVFNIGGTNNQQSTGYINNVLVYASNCASAHWECVPFIVNKGDKVWGVVQAGYGVGNFYPFKATI